MFRVDVISLSITVGLVQHLVWLLDGVPKNYELMPILRRIGGISVIGPGSSPNMGLRNRGGTAVPLVALAEEMIPIDVSKVEISITEEDYNYFMHGLTILTITLLRLFFE